MVLMVIFGAGASYDSYTLYPPGTNLLDVDRLHPYFSRRDDRPPLAQDLFTARYGEMAAKYPECQGLFFRLRQAASIERELERISNEQPHDPDVVIELLALRFYIRDVIFSSNVGWNRFTSNITNYSALLRTLRSWQLRTGDIVCLTTFNYDILLEAAWAGVLHREFRFLPDFIADPNWKLFKVHGSVVWSHRVQNAATPDWSNADEFDEEAYRRATYAAAVNSALQLEWTPDYASWTELEAKGGGQGESGSLWLPAIAMPTQTKTSFECPAEHLDHLAALIPQVTHLLVIGWRGAEQHFLSMWQGPNKPVGLQRLQLVTGSDADGQEVEKNLSEAGLTCVDTRLATAGFSAFLQSGGDEDFLNAVVS